MARRRWLWIGIAGLLLIPALGLAQGTPPGQRREHRRGGDPAQARERMLDNIKQQMGVTEEQWKALAPKVEKIMNLQRELRAGGMRGRGGEAANPPESKLAGAQHDLRSALENRDTPPTELAGKLAAYRDARDKSRAELQAAQKDLKEACTPRQEAVLVVNGLLD